MAKWGNLSLIRNGIVWFSDYKNPLGLYFHKPRIYPQGLSEKLCGRDVRKSDLARAQAPRDGKGRQKTRLKPRRMPPLEMPG